MALDAGTRQRSCSPRQCKGREGKAESQIQGRWAQAGVWGTGSMLLGASEASTTFGFK